MIHGDQKAKQMARSILPSRMRGGALMRALIHRGARREVRQVTHDPQAWEAGLELDDKRQLEVGSFVGRRRSSDKLNHFERWAIEITRGLPFEARLGHLKALLPGGLIGEHAVTHLKNRRELAVQERDGWRGRFRKLLMDRGELAELLRALLEADEGTTCLHRVMKQAQRQDNRGDPVKCAFRTLQGLDDVLPFIEWLQGERVSRFVVDGFCRVFKQTGDPQRALARTIGNRVVPLRDTEWTR